jgi:hypothetical protein
MLEEHVVHLPETAVIGAELGGLRRSVRANSFSTAFTTGYAIPQYGHSKSPYSTSVIGASARPRT